MKQTPAHITQDSSSREVEGLSGGKTSPVALTQPCYLKMTWTWTWTWTRMTENLHKTIHLHLHTLSVTNQMMVLCIQNELLHAENRSSRMMSQVSAQPRLPTFSLSQGHSRSTAAEVLEERCPSVEGNSSSHQWGVRGAEPHSSGRELHLPL